MANQDKKTMMRELIEQGKRKGRLTTKEISDVLDEMDFDSDQLDKLYDTLEACNIEVVDEFAASMENVEEDMSVIDAQGAPMDTAFALGSSSGIFLKWDAMAGAYAAVGASAQSDGETVVWSDQAPLVDAQNPVITIAMTDVSTGQLLGTATLTLTVEADSYRVGEDALAVAP